MSSPRDVVMPRTGAEIGPRKIQLQELSPRHRQVAALMAQGVDRGTIASIVDFTPEYITWLAGDALFRGYLKEMLQVAEAQLEALFERSVETIADQLSNGSDEAKLKAARLQLEATRRIGPDRVDASASTPATDRLEKLADRLTALMRTRTLGPHGAPALIDGSATRVGGPEAQ